MNLDKEETLNKSLRFSVLDRKQQLETIQSSTFDLIIIGG